MTTSYPDATSEIRSLLNELEDQLAQALVYLGGIDSISALYRGRPELHQCIFLFSTLYDALWDALVVKVASIWDKPESVSLRRIGNVLDRNQVANGFVDKVQAPPPELVRIKKRRNKVVAHRHANLDKAAFDQNYQLDSGDVKEVLRITEEVLAEARSCIGEKATHFEILKEDAIRNPSELWARLQFIDSSTTTGQP